MTYLWFALISLISSFPAAESDSGCRTTFQVRSCGGKPIPNASITLFTTDEGKFTARTDREGRAQFDHCLLDFLIPGDPKIYLSSGDSAYVYKVFREGAIIRVIDTLRIEQMSRYLRYSYIDDSDLLEVGDSVVLYRAGDPGSIMRMEMRYSTNQYSKLGIRKVRSKMKLSKKAVRGFLTGQCKWVEGELVCPINICSVGS